MLELPSQLLVAGASLLDRPAVEEEGLPAAPAGDGCEVDAQVDADDVALKVAVEKAEADTAAGRSRPFADV